MTKNHIIRVKSQAIARVATAALAVAIDRERLNCGGPVTMPVMGRENSASRPLFGGVIQFRWPTFIFIYLPTYKEIQNSLLSHTRNQDNKRSCVSLSDSENSPPKLDPNAVDAEPVSAMPTQCESRTLPLGNLEGRHARVFP